MEAGAAPVRGRGSFVAGNQNHAAPQMSGAAVVVN